MSLRAEVSVVTLSSAAVSAQTLAVQRTILAKLQSIQNKFHRNTEGTGSEESAAEIVAELLHHAELLARIKSDLDQIYLKIRSTKRKLQNKYPEAFNEAQLGGEGQSSSSVFAAEQIAEQPCSERDPEGQEGTVIHP